MPSRCLQGLLTIEAFYDGSKQPHLIIEQKPMKLLNVQMSKELQNILPNLNQSSYAVVGGLYQSSELLQPGFPIHTQLRQYANAALKGENNRRNQLVISANHKGLPEGLKQNKAVELTPLLLLPFVIITEDEETKATFEQQLMHKGMGSVKLLQAVQNCIGVKVRHVNFMTVLDLAAMMHNHMQMAGFEPLWSLLEQALFNKEPETKIKTPQKNEFYLSKKIVFTPFFTYRMWSNKGPGAQLKNKQEAYLHYTQVQRQHVATLIEHGLDVRQFIASPDSWPIDGQDICFASLDKNRITGDYYHEITVPLDPAFAVIVDKIDHPHLGVLFYQVSDGHKGLEFYYPMTHDGINAIEVILS